jgi:hypothetical protein
VHIDTKAKEFLRLPADHVARAIAELRVISCGTFPPRPSHFALSHLALSHLALSRLALSRFALSHLARIAGRRSPVG